MNRLLASASGAALALMAAGCIDSGPPASGANNPETRPEDGRQFHERLLEISRTYESFRRVDQDYGLATFTCAPPAPPSQLQLSASVDSLTHGRKMYA